MQEQRLDAGWGELSVLRAGDSGGERLLCLHGWMDNAASFEPLARTMPECAWVALDAAGHGASDHRPAPGRYYLTDYVLDIDAVLDALGWDQCTLVGHSLGTGIAACYACADPQRVRQVVMLDGLGVVTENPENAGQRLARSLHSVRHPRDHRRVFESISLAAKARQIKNPMSNESALLLARRALREDADGWRWRTDPAAMWDSPYWMTEEQSSAILRGIDCPVFASITPPIARYIGDRMEQRIDALADLTLVHLPGGHHLHMDDPDAIAGPLRAFLSEAKNRVTLDDRRERHDGKTNLDNQGSAP